jgi:hypothetical protein
MRPHFGVLMAPPNCRSVFDKTDGTRDSEKPATNDHMISNARLEEGSSSIVGNLKKSALPNGCVVMVSALNFGKTLPATKPD